jgi:hypothetical protein
MVVEEFYGRSKNSSNLVVVGKMEENFVGATGR